MSRRDGSGPPVGSRVVGHVDSGGWAEQAAVPTHRLAELPEEMTFVAAALPLAGLAALRLLRVTGPLSRRTILLTGASGGLGHYYFTKLAAGQGALVTAITASADRGTRLRELGAVRVPPRRRRPTAP